MYNGHMLVVYCTSYVCSHEELEGTHTTSYCGASTRSLKMTWPIRLPPVNEEDRPTWTDRYICMHHTWSVSEFCICRIQQASDAAFNKDLGGKKSFCATPTVKALALLLSFIFLLVACIWLQAYQLCQLVLHNYSIVSSPSLSSGSTLSGWKWGNILRKVGTHCIYIPAV